MMKSRRDSQTRAALAVLALFAIGCSDDGSDASDGSSDRDGSVQSQGDGQMLGDADGGGGADDSSVSLADASGSFIPSLPGTVLDTPPANTGLPTLPRLTSVAATAIGDSVTISFDPVDQAVDYRVYELPAASAVTAAGDGRITVKDAVFRCAGTRQGPEVLMDGAPQVGGGAIKVLVNGQNVEGHTRSTADATLGYVYQEPGDGRVPVYALGEHRKDGDNECFFQRWTASRGKQYVVTEAARNALLAQGFRDDGIAFYAPAAQSGSTRQIYTGYSDNARFYFATSAEQAARRNVSPAFFALTAAAEGAVPLMRAYYQNGCGMSHDELVAGKARFDFITKQGDKQALTKLRWAGLKGPTTLVIEALDAGCPFQGLMAPKARAGHTSGLTHQAYAALKTPEEIQAADPNHELFINGQFDGTRPKPIARSFVRIGPAPAPELDWSFGYRATDDFGAFTKAATCGCTTQNCCFQIYREATADVEAVFYSIEETRYSQRAMFGEWWVGYADWEADSNGKYRLAAFKKGDITADSFLYVSMDVDSLTTARRYPQILISDRDVPVQPKLVDGNTLILQTFADWPNTYELQVCDHRDWDVNNQCPRFDFYKQRDKADVNKITGLAPNAEVGEQVGMDHATRFEAYISSRRAYVFLEGKPYGCADLPTAGVPKGAVSVSFGDVLYHASADKTYDYTARHRQTDAIRHYDNLGFKSHVPPPVWDESRFPCTAHLLK